MTKAGLELDPSEWADLRHFAQPDGPDAEFISYEDLQDLLEGTGAYDLVWALALHRIIMTRGDPPSFDLAQVVECLRRSLIAKLPKNHVLKMVLTTANKIAV